MERYSKAVAQDFYYLDWLDAMLVANHFGKDF